MRGTKVGWQCEADFLRLKNAVFLGWSGESVARAEAEAMVLCWECFQPETPTVEGDVVRCHEAMVRDWMRGVCVNHERHERHEMKSPFVMC
jgi:hypothetical protein